MVTWSSSPAQRSFEGVPILCWAGPHERILCIRFQVRVRQGAHASATHRTFSSIPTGKNPTAPELNYLTAKLAALLPFGKVADLLGELLTASAGTNAVTMRNPTMRVGRRLEKSVSRFSTCVGLSLTGRLSRIFENGTETSVGSTPLRKHPTTFYALLDARQYRQPVAIGMGTDPVRCDGQHFCNLIYG
jgi:hypothetical protein